MSQKTFGIGIIGAGFMGHTHTYNYMTMPLFYDNLPARIKLVGICDSDLKKAQKLKDDFGFAFATNDWQQLITQDDIDIIDVCTPTIFHYSQIIEALKAEKHVYADKPLCATADEANQIIELAQKKPTIKQVAYHYRFFPAMMKTKMLIEQGFLGRPISYRVTYYHSSNIDPDKPMGWKQDKAMGGGGVLIEMACHVLDLMYHFLGRYETIAMQNMTLYAERPTMDGGKARVEGEDHVLLTSKMKSGMLGTMEVSKIMAGTNDDLNFEIFGTHGAIKFEMMNPNFLYIYDRRDEDGALGGNAGFKAIATINKYSESGSHFPGLRFPIGWIRGHVACQHNFIKNICDGTAASPSFEEAVYIQKITEAIYKGQTEVGGLKMQMRLTE